MSFTQRLGVYFFAATLLFLYFFVSSIHAQESLDVVDSTIILNNRMSNAQKEADSIEASVQSTRFHTASFRKLSYMKMYEVKAKASRAAGSYYSFCAAHTTGRDKENFSLLAWTSRHNADMYMNLSYSNIPNVINTDANNLGSGKLKLDM